MSPRTWNSLHSRRRPMCCRGRVSGSGWPSLLRRTGRGATAGDYVAQKWLVVAFPVHSGLSRGPCRVGKSRRCPSPDPRPSRMRPTAVDGSLVSPCLPFTIPNMRSLPNRPHRLSGWNELTPLESQGQCKACGEHSRPSAIAVITAQSAPRTPGSLSTGPASEVSEVGWIPESFYIQGAWASMDFGTCGAPGTSTLQTRRDDCISSMLRQLWNQGSRSNSECLTISQPFSPHFNISDT